MARISLLLLFVISFLWCINSGYCCSKELCENWFDYINNLNKCRTNGAVDYKTAIRLSFMPFIGFSNFYMGNTFAGCCELVNCIMALYSTFAINMCYDSFRRRYDNDATNIAKIVGIGIVILDLAKAIHMLASGSVEITEVVVIIISVIIACMHLAENDTQRYHGIVITTKITILTGVLETMRNIYAVSQYGRDGYGCPFV